MIDPGTTNLPILVGMRSELAMSVRRAHPGARVRAWKLSWLILAVCIYSAWTMNFWMKYLMYNVYRRRNWGSEPKWQLTNFEPFRRFFDKNFGFEWFSYDLTGILFCSVLFFFVLFFCHFLSSVLQCYKCCMYAVCCQPLKRDVCVIVLPINLHRFHLRLHLLLPLLLRHSETLGHWSLILTPTPNWWSTKHWSFMIDR
jgi:hypothetical protein